MPTNKIQASENSVMITIDHNNYKDYITKGDSIIVDLDKKPSHGNKVLAIINDAPHIMKYENLVSPQLAALDTNSPPILIAENPRCKVLGTLIWIAPAGREP